MMTLEKHFAVIVLIPLAMLQLSASVQAQTPDLKVTSTVTAPANSTSSSRNIYMAGGKVSLPGPVKGGIYAAGGRVTVDHPVQGDATLAGGSVMVKAAILNDLRVAGGDVYVENSVGGALYASGGNITLTSTSDVDGGATVYAGHATLEGKVNGPVKIYAQKVVLNGEVNGDVQLKAEEIEIGPKAKLSAALSYPADASFKTAEGAAIGGVITRGQAMNGRLDTHRDREWHGQMMGRGSGWAGSVAGAVFSFIALLAAAALLLLVFTGFSKRAALTMLKRPWLGLAAGMGVFAGTPMLAVLLCVTLIGIPLGIALMMIFPLILLFGWTIGVFGIAQLLQRTVQKNAASDTAAAAMGFFALTLLLVMLIGSLPFVGFWVVAVIWLLGTGACALEFYRLLQNRIKPGRKPPAPGTSEPTAPVTLPHTTAVTTT
jgi:cytoskeletal protein CcmA (bactofilin family)